MKKRGRAAFLSAAFFALPAIAVAQQQTKLRYLQIGDLSEEARSCGLQKALIAPIAAKELKESGIQITTVPTPRYVRLSAFVVALEQSQYCAIVWTLDIKELELISAGKGPIDDLRTHNNLLCRAELIGLYSRDSAQANISHAMRTLAAQCSRQAGYLD
jgi:hypothetical protein